MAGLKTLATKTATKGSKKPPPAVAKSFKSAEFVQESEDEEIGTGNVAAKKHAASVKGKVRGPSSGEKRASLNGRSALTGRTGKLPSSTPSTNDGGSDSRSTSERESDPGSPEINGSVKLPSKRPAKKPTSTSNPSLKRKNPSSDASGTETSADDVEERNTPTPARRQNSSPPSKARIDKAKQKAPVKEISRQQTSPVQDLESTEISQDESDNETEDGSEGQSDSRSSESGSEEEPTPVTGKKSTVQPSIMPYVAPLGFEAATISSNAQASHTELFSPSNLQGKQIWHITVPSSVPVSTIMSVAKKSVQDGSAVLSYKGADYGLISEAENPDENPVLLLPSDEDSRYRSGGTGIIKTLHLRQLVRLPSIAHDVGAQDAGTQVGGTVHLRKPYEKPVPEQPRGLKMRYKPIGVPDSDNSDVESSPRKAPKVPEFRAPGLPRSGQSPKKRKRNEATDIEVDEATSPKKKILKSNDSTKSSMTATNGSSTNQTPQKSKSSKEEAQKSAQIDQGIRSTLQSKTSQKPGATEESPTVIEPTKSDKDDHIMTMSHDDVSSLTKETTKKIKKKRKQNKDLISSDPKPDPNTLPKPSSMQASPVKSTPHDQHKNADLPPPTNGQTVSPTTEETPKPKKKKSKEHSKSTLTPSATTNGHAAPNQSLATTTTPIEPQTKPSPQKKHRKHKPTETTTTTANSPPSPTLKTSQPVSHTILPKEQTKDPESRLSKKSKIPGETVQERKERRAERRKRREAAADADR